MLILGGASVMNALTGMDIYAVGARAGAYLNSGGSHPPLFPAMLQARWCVIEATGIQVFKQLPCVVASGSFAEAQSMLWRAGSLPHSGRHHPVHSGGRPEGNLHCIVRAHGHYLVLLVFDR